MPAEILQQQPGGLSLVRLPDGREEWYAPDIAQSVVQNSYDEQSPVPDVAFDAPQMSFAPQGFTGEELDAAQQPAPEPEITMAPMEFSGEELDAAAPPQAAPVAQQAAPLQSRSSGGSVNMSMPASALRPMRGVQPAPPAPDFTAALRGAQDTAALERASADRELEASNAQIAIEQEGARKRQRLEQAQAIIHEYADRRAQEETSHYQQQIDEAMRSIPTMDPGRVWHRAGDFGSAMGIASAAIQGWLNPGGPNHALENINKLVDQDLRAQESEIDSAHKAVWAAERNYNRHEETVQQRFQRIEENRLFKLRAITAGIEAEAALFQSPIAQAKYAKTLAAANKQLTDTYTNLVQTDYSNRMERYKTEETVRHQAEMERQGTIGLGISAKNAETARRAQTQSAKGDQQGINYINDPQTGRSWVVDPRVAATMDKGEYAKVRESLPKDASALAAIKRYVARMNEVGRSYGGWGKSTRFAPDSETLAELGQLREKAINTIRHATAGANLTGFEIEIWEKIIPKPTTTTSQQAVDDAARFVELHGQEAQRKYANTYGLRDIGAGGELIPVDLTKEWGTAHVDNQGAPDAPELFMRLDETLKGVQLESAPKRGGSFSPSEPRRGEHPSTFTGEGPQTKAEPSESFRELITTATTLRDYIKNVPNETGVTPDLVDNIVRRLAEGAGQLDAQNKEYEAAQLLELGSEIKSLKSNIGYLRDLNDRGAVEAERPLNIK